MSLELWVQARGRRTSEVAKAALENGAQHLLVQADAAEQVASFSRIPVTPVTSEGPRFEPGFAALVTIASPDEQEAARSLVGKVDNLVVDASDWTVIPLENLVAWTQGTSTRLFAVVRTASDARLAATTLERGVDGVLVDTNDPATVRAVAKVLTEAGDGRLALVAARVVGIEDVGMGDRVCVDTTSLLSADEGLLVGSAASLMALVASEAQDSGYVGARPFRVNAGAVHAYVQAPDDRTLYLSEVQAGTRVQAVRRDGAYRTVVTGRAKVERRPMLLVRLAAADREGSVVVQNAETIRLVGPSGPISVAELSEGDEVLVHVGHQGGRHFGTAVEESLTEV